VTTCRVPKREGETGGDKRGEARATGAGKGGLKLQEQFTRD